MRICSRLRAEESLISLSKNVPWNSSWLPFTSFKLGFCFLFEKNIQIWTLPDAVLQQTNKKLKTELNEASRLTQPHSPVFIEENAEKISLWKWESYFISQSPPPSSVSLLSRPGARNFRRRRRRQLWEHPRNSARNELLLHRKRGGWCDPMWFRRGWKWIEVSTISFH